MRAFTAGRGFSGVCQLGVCQLVLGVDPGCVWLAPLEWGATEGVVVVERCVRGGLFVSSTAMIVRIVSLQSNTAAPGIVSPWLFLNTGCTSSLCQNATLAHT